jgi:hypothetical protein
MNIVPNTIVSLLGGPLCGESVTMKGSRIPNSIPMFSEGRFYVYNLTIAEDEDWTTIHYEYSNEVMQISKNENI